MEIENKTNTREFNLRGLPYTVIFYKKPQDEKYSFKIKNEDALTELLLNNVATKRVKESDFSYVMNGIKTFFKCIDISEINTVDTENHIVFLSEMMQKKYGKNIKTRVLDVHLNGEVHAEITLPNGMVFTGFGFNQRMARRVAAKKALGFLNKKQ